jgi:uncharacterized protein (DUF1778 family)
MLISEIDTINYSFQENYTLRNQDTIKLKLITQNAFLNGKEIKEGMIDAIKISAETTLPNYELFVSKKNDITFFMNQENGL